MLELYHSVNSVCAQKVRVALAEKGLEYKSHLMTLRGDQFDPAYMKLNPNARRADPRARRPAGDRVLGDPVLRRRGVPDPPLMPRDPHQRAKVRIVNKLVDEYVHNSCTILTFATAFRPWFAGLTGEEIEQRLAKSPLEEAHRVQARRGAARPRVEVRRARRSSTTRSSCKLIDEAGGGWLAGKRILARRRRRRAVRAAPGPPAGWRGSGMTCPASRHGTNACSRAPR